MMAEISYGSYRFPPEIIQWAIWLYVRFTLSFRDVEDLLAERGIMVSKLTPILHSRKDRAASDPFTTHDVLAEMPDTTLRGTAIDQVIG